MATAPLTVNLSQQSLDAIAALAGIGKAAGGGVAGGGGVGGGKGVQAAIGQAAGGPLGALTAAIGPLGVAAGIAAAAFKAVSLAAPGTMERLNLAFEDTLAVVGQALVPVFEVLTSVIKTVGDVLATIMPPADSLREILQPIADTFRDLMEALAPVFVIIKDVLVVALKALAIAVQVVLLPFKLLAQIISAIFGGEQEKLKDSKGTAVRNISFTNQEAGLRSVYQAAYRSGQAPGQDKANIPGWLEKIHTLLNTISNFVKGIADKLGVAKEYLIDKPGRALGEGINALTGIKDRNMADAVRKGGTENIQNIRRTIDINTQGGRQLGDKEKEYFVRALADALKDAGQRGNAQKMVEDWANENARRGKDGFGGRL